MFELWRHKKRNDGTLSNKETIMMIKKVMMIIIIVEKINCSKRVPQVQTLICKLIAKQMNPPTGVNKVSQCGHVAWRMVRMVAARDRRWAPSAVIIWWLLSSAFPRLLSFFSCLVTQHILLFGVTMNHGNWLCCHISNTPAQGLTVWCVTAGRSSLLKGCTAAWPNRASVVQGHTASNHSKWSRITHVCRKNEDVLFKLLAIVHNLTAFTTTPSVFKLC